MSRTSGAFHVFVFLFLNAFCESVEIREKFKNLSVNPAGIVAAFYVEFYVTLCRARAAESGRGRERNP